jgi:hypothetical protein
MVDNLPQGQGPIPAPRAYLRRGPRQDDEEAGVSSSRAQSHPQGGFRTRMTPSGGISGSRGPPSLLAQSVRQSTEQIRAFKDKGSRDFFDRIAANTPGVFLCVGRPEKSKTIQVVVKDDDDEPAVLEKMRQAWKNSRKWLPFRKVTRVDEVRVSATSILET